MTVLLGFGRNAFEAAGLALPRGLGDEYLFRSAAPDGGAPLLRGSGLSFGDDVNANLAMEDLCAQIVADTKLGTVRAVVETSKALSDGAEPVRARRSRAC